MSNQNQGNQMAAIYRANVTAAQAVCRGQDGMQVVHGTRKKTKNCPEGLDNAVVVAKWEYETTSEGLNKLVGQVLMSAAEDRLNLFVMENPMASEVSAELFSVEALSEFWISERESGGTWLNREALEKLWNASSTWKGICGRDEFKDGNAAYVKMAQSFKDLVLKCSSKVEVLPEAKRNVILAKLADEDMGGEMAEFLARRIEQMARKEKESKEEFNFDTL